MNATNAAALVILASVDFETGTVFAHTVALVQVGGKFQITDRKHKKGARTRVVYTKATEAEARESFAGVCSLAKYWAGSITASVAQDVAAGRVVTIHAK